MTDERQQLTDLQRENFDLKRAKDSAQSVGVFRPGGAGRPSEMTVRFIDQHRGTWGVEPICAELPIAPSTYFLYKKQLGDPELRSERQRQDEDRRREIRRVWTEHQEG